VHESRFEEYLQYGPIGITVNAWYREGELYFNPNNDQNHMVVLIGIEDGCPLIFDSYAPHIKKLVKGYRWGAYGKIFSINRIPKDMPTIKENYLYKLVEGKIGKIALCIDNRLITHSDNDAIDKLNVFLEFFARNNGFIQDKIVSVKKDFWDDCEKANLKGEKVTF
jgi:hypothetical protein